MQVSINLNGDGNCKKCCVEHLDQWSKTSDFPLINPSFSGQRNSIIYAATSTGSRQALPHFPFDTVVKLNLSSNSVHTWSTGARRFIGEPTFVQKGNEEDDGYLLVVEVRFGNRTHQLIKYKLIFCTYKRLIKFIFTILKILIKNPDQGFKVFKFLFNQATTTLM